MRPVNPVQGSERLSTRSKFWAGVLLEVQHAENGNALPGLIQDKIDRVGKALNRGQSERSEAAAKKLRVRSDQAEATLNLIQEGMAQPDGPLFIPHESIPQVGLCLGSDDQPMDHVLRVMRALTSGQGEPASGLAS